MEWPDGLVFRPIEAWPGTLTPEHARRSSPFSAPMSNTVRLLDAELEHLGIVGGTNVLQLALSRDDLRIDGRPRAQARVAHPGVLLSFSTRPQSKLFPSVRSAVAFLAESAQEDFPAEQQDAEWLYRRAVKIHHPDVGGSRKMFDKVRDAYRVATAEDAYQFAVDTFVHWQDNLRAIALGMEALRKVARYGIVKGNEQYSGWKQLTA